ncbi:hypothetical protein EG329_001270 [Mollisiaceae sp. DMI_Dod_QoI]|nr:hypothetical protein EG329_001270 [Helotiales sp. DMI_Dod_QoI]
MAEVLGVTASIVGLASIIQKTLSSLRETWETTVPPNHVHPILLRLETDLKNTCLLLDSIPKLNLSPSWSRDILRDLEPVMRELMALAETLNDQLQSRNGSMEKRIRWTFITESRATKKLDDIETRLAAIKSTLPSALGVLLSTPTISVSTSPEMGSNFPNAEARTYGLKVLCEPTSSPDRTDNYTIVFIHGLNSSSLATWGAVDKYWPRDLLPQDVPEARILTYDYDFHIPMSSSHPHTHNAEKILVDSVVEECCKHDSSQSLIFCAHSFGGILLQKAVARCCKTRSIDRSSGEFLSALKGFIFLGTPHFSNRTVPFQSFFEKLAPLAPRKALGYLTSSFESVINDLNVFDDFVEDENLPVYRFYEEQPTLTASGLVKLATDESFFLKGDHLSMCRFQTRRDDGYMKVILRMRQIVRSGSSSESTFERLSQRNIGKVDNLKPLKADHKAQAESHTLIQAQQDYSKKRRAFIELLKERIRPKRRVSERLSGSCEWIQTTEKFKKWRSEKHPKCFVILGQAGSGRTQMAQYLIEDFKRTAYNSQTPKFDRSRLILSYFCDWTQASRDKALTWLYDLLLQLLESDISLFKEIYRKLETPPTTYSDLEALVLRLLQTSSLREIDLIIDGLDECDTKSLALIRRTIIEVITSDDEDKIRILLTTSELTDDLKVIIDRSEKFFLDSYVAQRNQQIEAFIDYRLRRSINRHRYPADLLADVSRELYQRAAIRQGPSATGASSIGKSRTSSENDKKVHATSEGNFIWIALAIDIIEAERSVGNIKKTLRSLPLELGSLYDIILRKIPKNEQEFIARVLHFISCALGPLETDALAFALAINGNQSTTLEVLDEQNIDLQASLILYTGNLLVFDNDSVSFAHQTFSQYLNDAGSSSLLPLDIGKSNNDIATACLRCLMLDDTMNGQEPSNVPFLAYSDRHWFEHVNRASDSDGKLGELLMTFVGSQRLWMWLQRRRATQFDMLLPESQNYLHILAALDLLDNKDTLNRLSQPGGIDTLDSLERTPLHYALANNASRSIDFLLGQRSSKAIVDKNGWSCTHFAVYSGDLDLIRKFSTHGPVDASLLNLAIEQRHWAVVDRLLERIRSTASRDPGDWRKWKGKGGRGIIHQAVLSRHKAMVDKLLSKNVDLGLTDDEGMNALHLAAKLGECSIAQALIGSNQLSIEAKDKNLNTALHLATEAGDIDVIRLLTEHHASLEYINKAGQLPLHIAAMYGYEKIVDLLLAMGSPVNTDDEHASPLHMASAWGWHKVAVKLIKAGADIESRDEKGRTPLYLAAYNGSRITVDLLLRYKANPNIADTDGRSPLHVAALDGWEPVVNLLLKRGADVNTISKQHRRTPLHYAARSKNPSDGVVKRLLDADANLMQKDADGATAHDLAEKSNNTLIAELLSKAQQQQQKGRFSAPSSLPSARNKTLYNLNGSFSATSMEIFESVETRQREEDKDVFSRLKGAGL